MEKINLYCIALLVIVVGIFGFALTGMQNINITETLMHNDTGATGEISGAASIIKAESAVTTPSIGNVEISDSNSAKRKIVDLAGRTVIIPTNVSKVLCTSPPPSTYVYMLAPDKLCGWQLSLSEEGMKYISEQYRDIPTVGWGDSINYEQYILMDPDLVFVMYTEGSDLASVEAVQEKLGSIPVVCMPDARNATEYDAGLKFIGDVLGVSDVADKEISYYQRVLEEVQEGVLSIPEEDRVRVYYAEGSNGLQTDPSGSCHSQLIDIAGGINVADCEISSGSGMTEVTKESVLKWNPEVIITTSTEFYEFLFSDSTWEETDAVRMNRVYLTPHYPYNWFDRPPGINRIVGLPWTAHVLYPDKFPDEWFESRAKEFYSVFYHYDLTDEDLSSLLAS